MTKIKPDSVFKYQCPYEYLRHIWHWKKSKNRSFSLRAWSRDLGFSSNTTLSLLLNKKRAFTKTQAVKFIKSLKLTTQEADYFETLIDHSLEYTKPGKKFFEEKLIRLREVEAIRGEKLASFEYFSSPLVIFIFEMVALKSFRNEVPWIKKRIDFEVSAEEVAAAIETLKKLNLITENKEGFLEKTQNSIHFEFNDPIDDPSLLYHQRVLELIKGSVSKGLCKNKNAKMSSYFFNVEKNKVLEAVKAIEKFNDSFIQRFEAPTGHGEETYQLSVQFLPFTRSKVEL